MSRKPFRVSNDVVQEVFSRNSNSTKMWELKAVELRYAMEIVFRQVFADTAVKLKHRTRKSLRPSLHTTALMLAGMMIECYAKAILIEQNQQSKVRELKNHDLVVAIQAVKYSPNKAEEALLRRLSEFLRWAGRYPAPLRPENLAVNDELGNRNIVGGASLGDDLVSSRKLADNLESMLTGLSRVRTGTRLPSGLSSADPKKKQRHQ